MASPAARRLARLASRTEVTVPSNMSSRIGGRGRAGLRSLQREMACTWRAKQPKRTSRRNEFSLEPPTRSKRARRS